MQGQTQEPWNLCAAAASVLSKHQHTRGHAHACKCEFGKTYSVHVQGDCLQQLGDSIIESCAGLPNAELTAEVEVDARKNAGAVFKQAVQAYRKVGICIYCRYAPPMFLDMPEYAVLLLRSNRLR